MAFAPTDIANLAAWWKADTIGLSDGASVTTWADSSGNGLTLTATGTGSVYKTAGLNSLPTVRFPGTATNYLANDAIAVPQPCTAFVVARRTAATGATGDPLSGYNPTNTAIYINSSQQVGVWMDTGTELGTFSAPATVGHVFEVIFNGASSVVTVDSAGRTYTGGTGAFNGGISVGVRANRTGEWFDGDVAEIVLYSVAVAAADRFTIRAYLGAKYGVPLVGLSRPILRRPASGLILR